MFMFTNRIHNSVELVRASVWLPNCREWSKDNLDSATTESIVEPLETFNDLKSSEEIPKL